jgi:hypothetical protein
MALPGTLNADTGALRPQEPQSPEAHPTLNAFNGAA